MTRPCNARVLLGAPPSMDDAECRWLWQFFSLQMDEFEANLERMTPAERAAVLRPGDPE